jgi:hypothetical protein
MGKGEIEQRGDDATRIVEEKQADRIEDGHGKFGLDEDGITIAEAIVRKATETDLRVDVGATDCGLQVKRDNGVIACIGDGQVGAEINPTIIALLHNLDDIVAGGVELFVTISAGIFEDVIKESRAEPGVDVPRGNIATNV